MKQIKIFKGLLVAILLLYPLFASAYDFAEKNDDGVTIYYDIVNSSKRTCEVSSISLTGRYSGSVIIPETVKRSSNRYTYTVVGIGRWAFWDSSELICVKMPTTITYINEYAFYGCQALTSLTLGASLTSIDYYAFYNCLGLKSIYSPSPEPPECIDTSGHGYKVFGGVDKESCILYVPIGSHDAYATADQWQDFYNIVETELTNEGFYEKFMDDVEDLEALLQETWDVITSEYSDVSNEFKGEYDSLVDELDKLLEEIMDAYRNGNIMERMYEFMEKIEELKQKIEALLAAAKEAHETSAGIDNINIDPSEVEGIYSISGQRVNTMQRGVNILRYSDGATKKVMVKTSNN